MGVDAESPAAPANHRASTGADNGTRTRALDLGKVALYQLSYVRALFAAKSSTLEYTRSLGLSFADSIRRRATACFSGVDLRAIEGVSVVDDVLAARRHLVAHEQVEHASGLLRVLHADAAQQAAARIHGGVGQLVGVHFA